MTEPQASSPVFLLWALLPPPPTPSPAATESSGFGLRSNSQVVWRLQCRLHVPSVPPQAERASALRKNRICPTTPSRRELLEQQVEELVPALLRLDNPFLFEFLKCFGGIWQP